MKAPICPLCKINEREYDSEPPGRGTYFSHCHRCSSLITQSEHNHTEYPSPVQVKAGSYRAGQSWRTSQTVVPIMESGVHVGYRCTRFEQCGWERRFTPEELEPCTEHTDRFGFPIEMIKGRCARLHVDRLALGEIDGRGYITEHGRDVEVAREIATTWDPGRYIEPVR